MRAYRKVLLGAGWVLGIGILGPVGAAQPAIQDQPVAPAASTSAETPHDGKAAVDPDKRVCKRSMVTGSRFAKMVCHTQAQWDDMAQGTRSQMREIDSMRVSANGQAGVSSTGP